MTARPMASGASLHLVEVAEEITQSWQRVVLRQGDPGQIRKLADHHRNGNARHVSHEDRSRQQVGEKAEACSPTQERDRGNCQSECCRDVGALIGAGACADGCDGRSNEECRCALRSDRNDRAASEEAVDEERAERGPQAGDGLESRETCVRQALRHEIRRYGQTCQTVGAR